LDKVTFVDFFFFNLLEIYRVLTIETINTTMQSSMEEVKQELTTHLESVFSSLCTKLKIPTDDPFSDSPPKIEGEHSSHSHTF
jgi:hypothetical protein